MTGQFCRIYNKNEYTYEEKFRDELIVIPPGKFIEMERSEAALFMGQFNGVARTPDEAPDPRFEKKLKKKIMPAGYVPLDARLKPAKSPQIDLRCECCGYMATSKEDLEKHSQQHFHQLVDEEEKERIIEKKQAEDLKASDSKTEKENYAPRRIKN